MVICLERGADLHTAQLMPLSLTVSCFSKIQIGFTFLVPAHPGGPGQRAVKRVFVLYSLQCRVGGFFMGKNLVCYQPVGSTGVGGNSGDPFTEWCDQLMNRSIGRYRPIGAFIAAIATIVVDDRPMHKLVTAFAEYYTHTHTRLTALFPGLPR